MSNSQDNVKNDQIKVVDRYGCVHYYDTWEDYMNDVREGNV